MPCAISVRSSAINRSIQPCAYFPGFSSVTSTGRILVQIAPEPELNVYTKPHAIPRRGKARPKESDLLARLRRCEALLEKNGIEVQKALPEGGEGAPRLDTQDQDQEMEVGEKRMIFSHEGHHKSHIPHKHNGKLITKGGQSMYLEKCVHHISKLHLPC